MGSRRRYGQSSTHILGKFWLSWHGTQAWDLIHSDCYDYSQFQCVIRNSLVLGLAWEIKTTLKLEKVENFFEFWKFCTKILINNPRTFCFQMKTIIFLFIMSWSPQVRCSADTDSYGSEINNWHIPNYGAFNLFLFLETINSSDKIGSILTPD